MRASLAAVDRPGARQFLMRLSTSGSGPATVVTLGAVLVALVLSGALIAATGFSPTAALHALVEGSVASPASLTTTLLYAAPLLLVAAGTCVSTQAGVFNIGQEGQVLMGAFGAAWFGLRLALHGPGLLVMVIIGGALGGGLWAWLSALMYRYRRVNIVVSTLLMIFLAQQLVSFAVGEPWFLQMSGTNAYANPQSNPLPSSGLMGSLGSYPNLQINLGLVIALAATVAIAVALTRTRWGFRIRMMGLNPAVARHAGVRVAALRDAALVISGAAAGLAGAVLLASPVGTNRLDPTVSNNIGWDGLLVALVARNRPALCVPVSFLFGVLSAGGDYLSTTGVPFYLVDIVESLLVLALVVPSVASGIVARRRQERLAAASAGQIQDSAEVAA
jgi:general nucleoside transport system permease protein